MDKTTKGIFIVLAVLIIGAILMTYYRTIVRKDYIVFPDETAAEESNPADESAPTDIPSETEPISSEEGTDVTP